ncbi:MAG: hypothetical protein ACLUHJ_05385 [Ruminococcus sp.]
MQKKIFAWAMSMAVAAMITCTGCTQNSSTSSGTDSETAQTTTLDDNDTAEAAVDRTFRRYSPAKPA